MTQTFNIDECADFLNINVTTASELAAAGTIPGAKIGRSWVFLVDDLVAYLKDEVRRQQMERREKIEFPSQPGYSPIRRKSRGKTQLPNLDSYQSSDDKSEARRLA